jgi:hypothetical protein
MAYVDDFKFMFWVSLPTALLLLLMRGPKRAAKDPSPAAAHAAFD